ncbi:MAG: BACON domain-containing protein [Rikenellaceae bacterium]|nr:BACON domain-containing protein [Rikenellaceae bacterium]
MRTKIWAKMLSLVAILFAVSFTSCTPEEGGESKGSLTVDKTEVNLTADGKGADGKAVAVTVSSTSDISVVADEWIEAKKLNNARVTIAAAKNTSADARTGKVTITNAENLKAEVTVSQLGFAANLVLDADYEANPVVIAAAGNEETPVSLNVNSNVEWTVNKPAEADWLTVETTEDRITLTAEYSPVFAERTVTLTVAPTEASMADLAKKIVVKQEAQVHAITVEAEGVVEGAVTVDAADAELTFAVAANDNWTLSTEADWVEGAGEYTANDEEVLVIFGNNPDAAVRTATLTFTCGEATAAITVTQRGAGVFIEFDEKYSTVSAPSEATEVEIPVETNATSILVTAKDGANWITGTYAGGVVTLSLTENTSTPREAVAVLTGSLAGAENLSVEITVKQNQYAENLAVNSDGMTETANTYAIYKSGAYKFPATVKGNGAGFYDAEGYDLEVAYVPGGSIEIPAETIEEATLLWSTKSDVDPLTQASIGLLTNVSYSGGYVYFTMPEPFEVGNAGIAIKDKKGNILWSWHIWATPFDVNAAENTYPVGQTPDGEGEDASSHTTGYAKPSIFMGLNLGATHDGNHGDCSLDELQASMGYMYNWGRKDPFPGGYPNLEEDKGGANMIMYYHDQDIDLPEDITPAESTEISMYNVTPPYEKINDNIDWAIAHPTVYLKSVGTYGDNCIYSNLPTDYGDGCDANENSSYYWGYLWGNYTANSSSEGSKSLHDPCPPGWQVPCGDHWHIVTSHGDNIGTWYASYAPWKLNVKEAWDSWNTYKGFDPESVFWPWAHNDDGSWNNDGMIDFTRGGNWKGGFNVFVGTSNRTNGATGELVTAANCPTGAFTPKEGLDEGRDIQPIDYEGTNPMFVPAAGWRMGYNPGMNRTGRVARYHCNQPQNITIEGNTWTKHQTMSMSMWLNGNFYRNSAVSWAEWMGNGHPVRCIKPVVVVEEPIE